MKPKYPARKRVNKRPETDSSDTRPEAPKPAGEAVPETSDKTPDAEESNHAQSNHETP
ncbi:MAG TPA: hypothetical protein VJ385_19575 [Fibrobacteria bacterium]|nr:hypothetical protein [Fibrobacteria bacterium]